MRNISLDIKMSFLLLLVVLCALTLATTAEGHLGIVPLPAEYTTGNAPICLSSNFSITIRHASLNTPADLLATLKRTEEKLTSIRHTYLSTTHGREFFPSTGKGCATTLESLILSLKGESHECTFPSIKDGAAMPAEDRMALERYTLDIPLASKATLTAESALGLFRGLTTFQQLFYLLPSASSSIHDDRVRDPTGLLLQQEELIDLVQSTLLGDARPSTSSGSTIYAPYGPYHIVDEPAFGWRAIMLDTSRNFFPKSLIMKQLDVMAMVKLNVFHWHITDSNSWPLHLDTFPELSQAAYSADQVYTEEDIAQIISYAGERGIDVVIEVDTPGHTATISQTYPDYVACFESEPWWDYAVQPPAGQLRFANETIQDFAVALFSRLAELVESRYVGTGGDELNRKCMMDDNATTDILEAKGWTFDQALDEFTRKTHSALYERRKIAAVWQEMVLEYDIPSLRDDTVVCIWQDSADARKVLDKGFKIVHAAADYFYLDCGHGGWIGNGGGGNSWCDPFKTWARIWSFDPFDKVSKDQRHLVLGGQVSLWAEQADETNLETLLWPRAAALSEVFWTPPGSKGYPHSSVEGLARIQDVRYRMVSEGVNAVPLQPHWCALRPGSCMGAR